MEPKKIKRHPVVCFGETLWDLLPDGKLAGGAPMNVAYHLEKLGKSPAIISKVGMDDAGRELLKILETKKICTDYIQTDTHKCTSIVRAEVGAGYEVTYTIVEDVAWDYIEYNETVAGLVQAADYFVFGSLATRSPETRETLSQLLSTARNKVLDINLRAPFYSRETIEWLLSHASILKLNLNELALISAWYSSASGPADRIKVLQERYQLEIVIVTMGARGAMLSNRSAVFSCNGMPVRVEDTIGSGDAFLAAALSKIIDGASMQETLEYANDLAAFVTTQKGACPDYEIIHGKFNARGSQQATIVS